MVSISSSHSLFLAVQQRLEMSHVVSPAQLKVLNYADCEVIPPPSKSDSESNEALLGAERPRLVASANPGSRDRHQGIC